MPQHESRVTRLRNLTASDNGFGLIEVLAVMVIVGLLAAIAVPQIGKFRERGYVTSLETDARAVIARAEAFYTEHDRYPTSSDLNSITAAALLSPGNFRSGTWSASENGVTFNLRNSNAMKQLAVANNKLGAVTNFS